MFRSYSHLKGKSPRVCKFGEKASSKATMKSRFDRIANMFKFQVINKNLSVLSINLYKDDWKIRTKWEGVSVQSSCDILKNGFFRIQTKYEVLGCCLCESTRDVEGIVWPFGLPVLTPFENHTTANKLLSEAPFFVTLHLLPQYFICFRGSHGGCYCLDEIYDDNLFNLAHKSVKKMVSSKNDQISGKSEKMDTIVGQICFIYKELVSYFLRFSDAKMISRDTNLEKMNMLEIVKLRIYQAYFLVHHLYALLPGLKQTRSMFEVSESPRNLLNRFNLILKVILALDPMNQCLESEDLERILQAISILDDWTSDIYDFHALVIKMLETCPGEASETGFPPINPESLATYLPSNQPIDLNQMLVFPFEDTLHRHLLLILSKPLTEGFY